MYKIPPGLLLEIVNPLRCDGYAKTDPILGSPAQRQAVHQQNRGPFQNPVGNGWIESGLDVKLGDAAQQLDPI